jgi:hypothetical protein
MIKDDQNKKICAVCMREKSIESFSLNKKDYRRKICKVCVSQGLKVMETTTTETKVCKACGIEKDIKQYHTAKGIGDGYTARCKKCKLDGLLIPKEKKEKIEYRPLTLAAPSMEDYIETYSTLKVMGYDLTKDIHEQFCKKYNLIPNNPKQKFKHHISQKDCGLI